MSPEKVGKNESTVTSRKESLLSLVLLTCSLLVNIVLGYRIKVLNAETASMRTTISLLADEGGLIVGATVPSLQGRLIDGSAYTVNYADTRVSTVLYVFTPACPWCEKNLGNLHALAEHSGTHFRLIGVSLTHEDLKEYAERQRFGFPIITDIPDAFRLIYRLGTTPETIVVSPEGRVLKLWEGAYHGALLTEVKSYLGIEVTDCCIASLPKVRALTLAPSGATSVAKGHQ